MVGFYIAVIYVVKTLCSLFAAKGKVNLKAPETAAPLLLLTYESIIIRVT